MIRVFTAFSGYDSQCLALERLKRDYPDFDYDLVGWSEIDKYAIQAHNALFPHWADRNYGDISKIDWQSVPDFDLFTYSSPCQDFSNAGLQRGGEEGSGTRSSLLWECRKAIVAKRPKYLMLENVKALVSKKFLPLLNKWIKDLEDYGYYNTWQVLNAKDYGVPQNRERVFLISIRRDLLDPSPVYHFPKPFPLELRLKDVLELKVDEKYYLSDKMLDYFSRVHEDKSHGPKFTPKSGEDTAFTIRTAPGNRVDDNYIDTVGYYSNSQNGRVIKPEGISTAMINGEKDGMPKIVEPLNADREGVAVWDDYNQRFPKDQDMIGTITTNIGSSTPRNGIKLIEVFEPICVAMRGRNPDKPSERAKSNGKYKQRLEMNENGTSNTITSVQKDNLVVTPHYRIRKLTPRECFRLMGVDDADIDKLMSAGISNSQLYKCAGNSIVVDTLYHLFRKLFCDKESEEATYQQTLF